MDAPKVRARTIKVNRGEPVDCRNWVRFAITEVLVEKVVVRRWAFEDLSEKPTMKEVPVLDTGMPQSQKQPNKGRNTTR